MTYLLHSLWILLILSRSSLSSHPATVDEEVPEVSIAGEPIPPESVDSGPTTPEATLMPPTQLVAPVPQVTTEKLVVHQPDPASTELVAPTSLEEQESVLKPAPIVASASVPVPAVDVAPVPARIAARKPIAPPATDVSPPAYLESVSVLGTKLPVPPAPVAELVAEPVMAPVAMVAPQPTHHVMLSEAMHFYEHLPHTEVRHIARTFKRENGYSSTTAIVSDDDHHISDIHFHPEDLLNDAESHETQSNNFFDKLHFHPIESFFDHDVDFPASLRRSSVRGRKAASKTGKKTHKTVSRRN